jgi:hypothetical protein
MSFATNYFTDPMVVHKNKAKNTELSIILQKSAFIHTTKHKSKNKEKIRVKQQSQIIIILEILINRQYKKNPITTSHINNPIN